MKLNKHGFSLIEVMVTVGILSIIALGTMTMFTNMLKSQKDIRTLSNRDYTAVLLRHFAGDHRAIEASRLVQVSTTNDPFRRCLDGLGTGLCPTAKTEFSLFSPAGIRIAGTVLNPVRYTPEGAICPGPASSTCPLEAIAWYTPFCPTTAACGATIAVRIDIDYMVKKSTAVAIPGLAYASVCSSGATGCTSATPPISIAIPLNNPTSVALNRLGYWSSTTGYTPSNARQDSTTGNLFLNESATAVCDGANAGGLRTRNGALQVCDGPLGVWKNASGTVDSSVSNISGYPNLKNLFLCPAGGNLDTCGGASPCIGQISKINFCCMSSGLDTSCTSLY